MSDIPQAIYTDRISYMHVSLDTLDVTVEEEYVLQDFFAIVATLGGSVGIFLGWSLFDLFNALSALLVEGTKKKADRGS